MSENGLRTYALIKALFDRKKNYTDAFVPFLLQALEGGSASVTRLQASLSERLGVSIPVQVIERIAERAAKSAFIASEYRHGTREYALTDLGSAECSQIEGEHALQRRINALLDDMCLHSSEAGVAMTREAAYAALRSIVEQNLESLVGAVNPRASASFSHPPVASRVERAVLAYLEYAQDSRPEHYQTLRDLVLGSVLAGTLFAPSAEAFNEMGRGLGKARAYLDTNVIFGVLGMQSRHVNAAAVELVRLLQTVGAEVRTFDFVLDEARNVIKRYARGFDVPMVPGNMESVYVQLRLQGVMPSKAMHAANQLEQMLADRGVSVERPRGFDIGTWKPDSELLSELVDLKSQGREPREGIDFTALVDLAAVELMVRKRGQRFARLEDAKYFFVTRDRRLERFNRVNMRHGGGGTVPEVILDTVMTNVLWLKNPGLDVGLEAVVAAHSLGLLRQDALWGRFCEVLAEMRQDDQLTDDDIAYLLVEENMNSVVRELDEVGIEAITPEFVLDEAHRARDNVHAELESTRAEKERLSGVAHSAEERASEATRVLERERCRADSVRRSLTCEAEDVADRRALLLALGLVALVVAVLTLVVAMVSWLAGGSGLITAIAGGAALLLSSGGGWFAVGEVKGRLYRRLLRRRLSAIERMFVSGSGVE